MKFKYPVSMSTVAITLLFVSPLSATIQTTLGSAADFVVLAGTSTSVAVPIHLSNGDVGGTTVTGGPSVDAGFEIIQAPDARLAPANTALITAQNSLRALELTNPVVNLSGQTLSGMTLAAGVYKFDVAAAFDNGTLLQLDAGGLNGGRWVFNIGTSLTTAALAGIEVINLGSNLGADLEIYWNAGAEITIGANNTIIGNYLSGTSITVGTTAPANDTAFTSARALAQAGVSFDGTATLNALGPVYLSYVLLSADGTYVNGSSDVVLTPGTKYQTGQATIDGNSSDAAGIAASLTVFKAIATLTGTNTFTGGIVIDGGTLITGTANLPVDGSIAMLSDPTFKAKLVFDQPVDGTFGGVISGDGSVTKQNTGMLTLTGVNSYTGTTTVNGGTLALSGAGTLGNTANALTVNAGTLDLGGTALTTGAVNLGGDGMINNGTLTGTSYTSTGGTVGVVLAGTGAFTNTSGTTTLTGVNTYTGGTTVIAGTLVASTLTLPVDQDVDLSVGSTLVLDEAVDGSFGGTVTGTGTIEKQGAGSLMLANSTDSAIDLQAGSFVLTDNSVGDTTVASGAFLRGNGTINGSLFNNGTVSPGNSPGTIIVAGSFTQGSGGTFVVEIASDVLFDKLIVTGSATLDGTLDISVLGAYNPDGKSFEIIQAAGGVNGQFASDNSAALESTVIYGANNVVITFDQLAFATFAGTPNQTAIANTAQQSPTLTTALNAVPLASQLPAAMNALSPQGYQVWSEIAFAHSASLGDRLRRQPNATEGHDDFYFEVAQSRGSFSGDLDVGSSRYTSDSGLVGGNHFVSENLTLGGFFEYTETDSGMGSAGSSTTVKSKMPGIRAAWKKDAWFANAIAAYGFDDYESTRAINFPGTSATAKSETTGRQWVMDVSGGRRFQAGPVSLSPFAGLQASGWKADGFTETGAGALNATVGSQKARSLRTQLGLEAAVAFDVGSIMLRPHARGAWIHELSNDSRSIDGSIDGVSYSVVTRDPQRDSARLSAGLDVVLSQTVSLYADYSIQTGNNTRVLGEWRGGLAVRF
jgi:outer membrane autotransporter protein